MSKKVVGDESKAVYPACSIKLFRV